jgi:hypothetical protein
MMDDVLSEVIASDAKSHPINTAFLQLRIVEEKLEEIDRLVQAIIELAPPKQTSVAKHVDIVRRSEWIQAVQSYRAAEDAPIDADTPDAVFDAAGKAFIRMMETPAPDLRALHEKLTLVNDACSWTSNGVTDALFRDVERLVRADAAAQQEG